MAATTIITNLIRFISAPNDNRIGEYKIDCQRSIARSIDLRMESCPFTGIAMLGTDQDGAAHGLMLSVLGRKD
jgi:hypothetical protein